MITVLRRKLKSKAAKNFFMWIVVIAIASGFVLGPRLFRGEKRRWVASVNGKEVSPSDFYLKTRINEMIIRSVQMKYGKHAELFLSAFGMESNPIVSAYNQTIVKELLNQEASQIAIHLDSNFILKKLSDVNFIQREFPYIVPMEAIDPNFGLNLAVLKPYLLRMGVGLADFENMAISAMRKDVVLDIVSGSSYIPEFAVKNSHLLDYLARKFSVLTLDFGSFLAAAKEKEISKSDLKLFFDKENAAKKRYWVPEKRSGIAYVFDSDSYGVVVDEDEIKNYYEDHKIRDYVEKPAQIQVRRILFRIGEETNPEEILQRAKKVHAELLVEPSQFSEYAKKFSEDKKTAEQGGLLPFFSKGERNREFEKAGFLLRDDGAISQVVRTDEGFEILQRVARKDAEFRPLKSVKKEIRENVLGKKFRRLFSKDMSDMVGKKYFDAKRFDEIIQRARRQELIELQPKGEEKRSSALFRIRNGVPAFYFDDGKGYVVKMTDLQKRNLPSLETIEDIVKNDLYEEKASKDLDAFVKRIEKEARAESFQEIKVKYKKYSLDLYQTGWVKKNDAEKIAALRSKGYPVDEMLKLEKPQSLGTYRDASSEIADAYLVKVVQIEPFNGDEYAEKRDEIKKELAKKRGFFSQEEFIAFLRKVAKIKVNAAVVRLPKRK